MRIARPQLASAMAAVVASHLLFLALVRPVPLGADALEYHTMGARLAAGFGYVLDGVPVTSWMPGYPLFVAAIYRVCGAHPWAVRIVQTLLFALADGGLYLIVHRRYGARPAAFAFTSLALLPAWFVYPGTLNAETCLFATEIAFLAVTLWSQPSVSSTAPAFWSGVACGVMTLVKPDLIVWLPLSTLASLRAPARRIAATLMASVLGCLLVIAPWIVRNAAATHRFIPLSTKTGHALWLAGHQPVLTEFADPEFNAALRRCEVPGDPKATDGCLLAEGAHMVAAHPFYYLETSAGRVVFTLFGSHTEYFAGLGNSFSDALRNRRLGVVVGKGVLLLAQVVFVLVGLAGLIRLCRHRRAEWIWLYLLASKLAVHAALFGTARYGLHLSPILAIGWAALGYKPRTLDPGAEAAT